MTRSLSFRRTQRTQLSAAVLQTHRWLVGLFSAVFVGLMSAYLFWLNHQSIQTYRLNLLAQEHSELKQSAEQIDARLATYSAHQFVLDSHLTAGMVSKAQTQYIVLSDILTAQAENTATTLNPAQEPL